MTETDFPEAKNALFCEDAKPARSDIHLLKEDIEKGQYRVSSGKVAERIMSTQLFLFTHGY